MSASINEVWGVILKHRNRVIFKEGVIDYYKMDFKSNSTP